MSAAPRNAQAPSARRKRPAWSRRAKNQLSRRRLRRTCVSNQVLVAPVTQASGVPGRDDLRVAICHSHVTVTLKCETGWTFASRFDRRALESAGRNACPLASNGVFREQGMIPSYFASRRSLSKKGAGVGAPVFAIRLAGREPRSSRCSACEKVGS